MNDPQSPSVDLSGVQLGNYEITALLGRGGMGEVYLARHPLLEREVAVKVISGAHAETPEALERFRREALAVNRIAHPARVEVSDFGQLPDGRQYYVMARLRGQPLSRLLEGSGPLSASRCVELMTPVIEVLGAAHAAGIVHRDIKPDNIFLDQDETGAVIPRVLDFGIAKLLDPGGRGDAVTQTGQLLGTPLYMSPEQANGNASAIGPWSDVYSVGVVLYHMLVGHPPFRGDSYLAVLMQHFQTPPPPLLSKRPDLSPAVAVAVHRALEKQPPDRPCDMGTLLGELRAAVGLDVTVDIPAPQAGDPVRLSLSAPGGAPEPGDGSSAAGPADGVDGRPGSFAPTVPAGAPPLDGAPVDSPRTRARRFPTWIVTLLVGLALGVGGTLWLSRWLDSGAGAGVHQPARDHEGVAGEMASGLGASAEARRSGPARGSPRAGSPSPRDATPPLGPVAIVARGASACAEFSSYKCPTFKQAVAQLEAQPDRLRALQTLVGLAGGKDPRVAAAAAHLVDTAPIRSLLAEYHKHGKRFPRRQAEQLLTVLARLRGTGAVALAKTAARVAALSGAIEPLYDVVRSHPTPGVASRIMKHVAGYGRLAVLPRMKRWAREAKARRLELLLEGVLEMRRMSEAEKQGYCPWARTFLGHEDLGVARRAGDVMVRCQGDYIDALLAEGKRRVERGQWTKPFIWPFRNVCFSGFMGSAKLPAARYCKKTYRFLEWVANHEEVTDWYRAFALAMISYQRRNQTTYELMKKYRSHSNQAVRREARKQMAWLKKHYLKDSK
jgi:serine/threonine-protein kinase